MIKGYNNNGENILMLAIDQGELLEKKDQDAQISFEEMLDQYRYKHPKQGQILEGEIESIDHDAIILDVGLKRAAIVTSREVDKLDDNVFDTLSVGDEIPIEVTRTPVGDEDLLVSIENGLAYQSWQKVENYLENDQLLELDVIGSNRGGILVAFEKLEGFVPSSHIPALKKIYDHEQRRAYKQKMCGSQIMVKPIEVDKKERRLIFSALEAHKVQPQEQLNSLKVGEVISGKVVNIVDFGVFVDLGNIDGLVHVSELDWLGVSHPSDMVNLGEEIEVEVIGVDIDRERIQLSRKRLLPNPWDEIETKYVPGDLVEVEIKSVVDFGAFGSLPSGIQGLIHKTELGYTALASEGEILEPGTKVFVKILKIDAQRERISFSMRKVPMESQLNWMLNDFEQDI